VKRLKRSAVEKGVTVAGIDMNTEPAVAAAATGNEEMD
jgi:hypothetical protein